MKVHAVLRVSASPGNTMALEALGAEMNRTWPGIYTGLRKRSDCPAFDGDIARGNLWEPVVDELKQFTSAAGPYLGRLRAINAEVLVDIALWLPPSGRTQLFALSIDADLHEALGRLLWTTELSLYVEAAEREDEDCDGG